MSSSDSSRSTDIEKRIDELLGQMTLAEKVAMCHANTKFTSAGLPRLGIPDLCMSDGPHGVRAEVSKDSWAYAGWDDDHATYLPTGMALASTWNPEMGKKFGNVLGSEARHRNKDVILGPGFNIIRTPLCGRNFEYMSEDPYLITKMAPGVVRAIQACDTAADVKHFALNSQEMDRFRTNVEVDERTLREIYLPGFEACVKEGGVLTVMGAYNKFRGQHCCHNHYLLQQILKQEWGFKGLVVSDWNGVHDTDEAARNGMDVEMGTGKADYDEYFLARPFREGVENGTYDEELVNDKVRRILYVRLSIGMMDGNRKKGERNTPAHQLAAREIAREAMILLKNEGGALPLDRKKIKKLAVIGENADRKMAMGGGSSEVKTPYEITPLEGLRTLLGEDVEITYVKGYPVREVPVLPIDTARLAVADHGAGIRGWKAEFFANLDFTGEPACVRTDDRIDFTWAMGVPPVEDLAGVFRYCIRWTGRLEPAVSGEYRFGMYNTNVFKMYIDGELLFESERQFVAAYTQKTVVLEAGRKYEVKFEFIRDGIASRVEAGWLPPGAVEPKVADAYGEALAAAKSADAVVFVGGLNHQFDAEGNDRRDLKLPEGQNGLLEAVAAANPETVAVMVAGSPVEMPWLEKVKAVVWNYYGGMESGTALAEVLFGNVNPSGKLTVTFPKTLADSPAHKIGEYNKDSSEFKEGVMVGYRYFDTRNVEPLLPFGHGLSYTSFGYDGLEITMGGGGDAVATVRCTVKNTGPVAGAEVVQLYLSDPECSVERPAKELKGFAKVMLTPGEEKTVTMPLTKRDLSFYDIESMDWKAEAGAFTVQVGASSRDIRLNGSFEYAG